MQAGPGSLGTGPLTGTRGGQRACKQVLVHQTWAWLRRTRAGAGEAAATPHSMQRTLSLQKPLTPRVKVIPQKKNQLYCWLPRKDMNISTCAP